MSPSSDVASADQVLVERIRALGPWFHNLELNGIATAPDHFLGNYPRSFWQHFSDAIPDNLTGWSVLDVGCNAGFFSFEMKRRGAARVVGLDSDPRYLAQARFAAEVLELDVEFRQASVYDVASLEEPFDLVLFMGVLYHLRHPLLALDLLSTYAVRRLLVFQSMQRGSRELGRFAQDYRFEERAVFDAPSWPKLHFIERRYAGDETNWWVPNRACAEAMLRAAGFDILAHRAEEVYVCRKAERELDLDLPTAFLRGGRRG